LNRIRNGRVCGAFGCLTVISVTWRTERAPKTPRSYSRSQL
jgi:hypothetical protein